MSDTNLIISVVIMAAVTMCLRFLPFIIFNANRETPAVITYLGTVLPYAIMGMLVVYCLKDMTFKDTSQFLPQIISCLVVILLHVWRRNTLISIVGGTLSYMLFVQLIFS